MRLHKITDGRPLSQEFRAGYNRKLDWFRLVFLYNIGHPVSRTDRDSGFIDNDQRRGHRLGDCLRRDSYILHICFAINSGRCRHGNEGELGLFQSIGIRGGKG